MTVFLIVVAVMTLLALVGLLALHARRCENSLPKLELARK